MKLGTVPFAPLSELAERLELFDQHLVPGERTTRTDTDIHDRFKEQLGVTYRSYARWRDAGTLPLRTADRIAVHVGSHIDCIWKNA